MDISNLFQLTDEDKAQYKKLIDEIDLDNSSSVIGMLNTKLETLLSTHKLNDMEVDLIKNVSVEADGKTAITDIGILYEEVLTENQIHFVPRISIIDCLKGYRAHRLIDAELKTMILPDNNKIELGTTISHFFINKDEFTLFINNN